MILIDLIDLSKCRYICMGVLKLFLMNGHLQSFQWPISDWEGIVYLSLGGRTALGGGGSLP